MSSSGRERKETGIASSSTKRLRMGDEGDALPANRDLELPKHEAPAATDRDHVHNLHFALEHVALCSSSDYS